MLYDRLAKAVERLPSLHYLFQIVSKARLFTLDSEVAHLPSVAPEAVVQTEVSFFLPYKTVALEDRQKVVLLSDDAEDVQGLLRSRSFVLLLDLKTQFERWIAQGETIPDLVSEFVASMGNPRIVAEGQVRVDGLEPGVRRFVFRQVIEVRKMWLADDVVDDAVELLVERVTRTWDTALLGPTIGDMLDDAFNTIALINTPARFVLESSPLKVRDPKKGRILRSHQRPTYTILEPERIRHLMKLPSPTTGGPKKRPHERRRHTRYLASACFTKMRGERIVIPATWIGPAESVVGNRRYRVILD